MTQYLCPLLGILSKRALNVGRYRSTLQKNCTQRGGLTQESGGTVKRGGKGGEARGGGDCVTSFI